MTLAAVDGRALVLVLILVALVAHLILRSFGSRLVATSQAMTCTCSDQSVRHPACAWVGHPPLTEAEHRALWAEHDRKQQDL